MTVDFHETTKLTVTEADSLILQWNKNWKHSCKECVFLGSATITQTVMDFYIHGYNRIGGDQLIIRLGHYPLPGSLIMDVSGNGLLRLFARFCARMIDSGILSYPPKVFGVYDDALTLSEKWRSSIENSKKFDIWRKSKGKERCAKTGPLNIQTKGKHETV